MRTAAIWTSHASAIEMLSLVSKPDISPLLYFAQDSVHVMIAYAAVFLVKVSRGPLISYHHLFRGHEYEVLTPPVSSCYYAFRERYGPSLKGSHSTQSKRQRIHSLDKLHRRSRAAGCKPNS